jgi:hypothetical protein
MARNPHRAKSSAFVAALAGATYFQAVYSCAADTKSMTFWRDDTSKLACLEYSWVPTGQRHAILLGLGEDVKSQDCKVSSTISKVQVYSLSVGGVGLANLNFPSGTSPESIAYASIEVFLDQHRVTVTVHYSNGSTASDTQTISNNAVQCPTNPLPCP